MPPPSSGRPGRAGQARLFVVDWPVRTDRLTIRPAVPADAEATWAYRRLPEVAHWITAAPSDTAAYVAHFRDPDRLAKTLVVELAGVVIGDLMVVIEDGWGQAEVAERVRGVQAELGWVLHPDHGGSGYATEAVAALVRICFEELGLRRVTAQCFVANESSWRLMERLGMRRELHSVQESLHRSGTWLDGYGYALLAQEWGAAPAQSSEPSDPSAASGSSGSSPGAGKGPMSGSGS